MSSGNLSRKIQLGLLATDMAAARGDSQRAERARRHVRERLGKLHGLPQKIGQILSLSELQDDDIEWTELTETAPCLDPELVQSIIESELGIQLAQSFSFFDASGIAASLSQVHRARTVTGLDVAVKVQIPGIENAVDNDLRSLGWLTAPVGGLKKGFNLPAYQREVRRILDTELDFRAEADTMLRFQSLVASEPACTMPRVLPELSTRRVLTMTWLGGDRFRDVRQWSAAERSQVAERMVRLFLRSGLEWRLIHGDPHPGNLRFNRTPSGPIIGLLDFGCVRDISEATAEALHWLIHHVASGTLRTRHGEIRDRYVAAGFDPQFLDPMAPRLYDLTELLFEPFRHDRPFALNEWRMSQRIDEVLGDDRWNFRFAGPPDLIVFIRAYQGLLQYLKALDAPVNWRGIFSEISANLSIPEDTQPTRTATPATPATPGPKSNVLSVSVFKDGRQTVQVKFKAEAAARIDELMPDDVLDALRERNIDLEAMKRAIVQSNFAPADLFTLEEGNKQIFVRLQ